MTSEAKLPAANSLPFPEVKAKRPRLSIRWPKFKFPWHIFTTKRVLNFLYTFCTILILGMGLLMASLSFKWMYPYNGPVPGTPSEYISKPQQNAQVLFTTDVSYLDIILSPLDIYTGLGVGVLLIASFFAALPSIMSSGTSGLVVLNMVVVFDILAMIAGGTILWFRDLRPRENLWAVWQASPIQIQATIQEQFHCCGYWDPTDLTQVVTSDVCPSNSLPGCVDPFGMYADVLLNRIFTFTYGVAAVLCVWFLVNGCIISVRSLEHRFRLIDQKQKEMGNA